MLSPDTWHLLLCIDILDLMFWHLTGIITPDTCITLPIHDYHFYEDLYMVIILLPDIWYSCTPKPPYSWTLASLVLMSPALLLLLIAWSYWRPAEHAWCRDDEDVSHDHASVRWILNGTKCYTEQSVTQSKVSCHTRGAGHLLNLWGYLLNLFSKEK